MHGEVCPKSVDVDALGERIAHAAAYVDVATHRLLKDIHAFDEAAGWHRHGATSIAHWLSWRVGMSVGAAREHARVARRLAELPRVDAAMAAGELSYSKARAITRVATTATEAELVDMAMRSTAAHLEKICRLYRAHGGPRDPRKLRADRYVRTRETDDGMVQITLQLQPDEAERVMRAIESSKPKTEPRATLADGALALAEQALRGDAEQRSPTEVTIHINAETVTGHTPAGHGITAETCRRLCCDAGLVPMLEDAHGQTIDVGRRTRSIPPAIRRALAARDGGCRFPGCTATRYLDGHHIEHWIDGGETSLRNTILLCTYHHHQVHEFGFTVEKTDDAVAFFDPRGRPIPDVGPCVGEIRGLDVPAEAVAPVPLWDGTPPDWGAAVDRLIAVEQRAAG